MARFAINLTHLGFASGRRGSANKGVGTRVIMTKSSRWERRIGLPRSAERSRIEFEQVVKLRALARRLQDRSSGPLIHASDCGLLADEGNFFARS